MNEILFFGPLALTNAALWVLSAQRLFKLVSEQNGRHKALAISFLTFLAAYAIVAAISWEAALNPFALMLFYAVSVPVALHPNLFSDNSKE